MNRYECKTAQNGYAAGRAAVLRAGGKTDYRQESPEKENARLEQAAGEMNRKLEAGREHVGPAEAAVIDAEMLILTGDGFLGATKKSILEEGMSAPEAVQKAAEKLCAMLAGSGQDYIRERCEDIRGLAAGLTALMMNGPAQTQPSGPRILVGTELSPGEIMMAGPGMIRGILTDTGSATSHVSVLAGSLGIPYLYGLRDIGEKIADGDYLILDSETGSVCVNPSPEEIREAEERQEKMEEAMKRLRTQAAGMVTKTKICANISQPGEADGLIQAGADGIGLFRSEFLFLNRAEEPSEEEQYAAYRYAAEKMAGREVTIRTMDIGSDKQAAWLELPRETNPALGLRGIRVSLQDRERFRTQLRALLRAAAAGNVRIMLPMIASGWELEEAEKEIRTAAEELEKRGEKFRIPEIGVMIETPAAVMIADELAEKARFFSIGTNDLTQYTLAVDREARGLDRYFNPMHEAVLRMIAKVTEAAHQRGIPVGVCGEAAGNPQTAEKLIMLGVDELSVSASKLAAVRKCAAETEEGQKRQKPQKQPEEEEIHSPAEGELIPMAEIPDPAFSGGMMGECVGIIPVNGKVYAPISGTVAATAATGHAVSLRGDDGKEILVHVGLDTVKLNGEGFTLHVHEGERVRQGQLMIEADPEQIRAKGFNPMIIVVRMNS